MSKLKISHSAYNRYHDCPHSYNLHYNLRVRPTKIGSPLVFGVAIDEALNALLLDHSVNAVGVFKDNFTYEMCENVEWNKNDLTKSVFTDAQMDELRGKDIEYVTWACMRIKGRLMIEAYVRDILPMIKEVHHVQLETEGRKGFVDVIATVGNHVGLLCDNKTTQRPYAKDAVENSTQLALYASSIKNQDGSERTKAAFITLVKKPELNRIKTCTKCGKDGSATSHTTCNSDVDGKRCKGAFEITNTPVASCQFIVGEISKEFTAQVKESFLGTEKAITAGIFPKKLSACSKMYGRDCPYKQHCLTGCMKDLEIVAE